MELRQEVIGQDHGVQLRADVLWEVCHRLLPSQMAVSTTAILEPARPLFQHASSNVLHCRLQLGRFIQGKVQALPAFDPQNCATFDKGRL